MRLFGRVEAIDGRQSLNGPVLQVDRFPWLPNINVMSFKGISHIAPSGQRESIGPKVKSG